MTITAPFTEDPMSPSRMTTPAADTDTDAATDATATTTAIAGLRHHLTGARALNHPAVRCELRKLEELLASQIDQAGHKPGRHRSPVSVTTG